MESLKLKELMAFESAILDQWKLCVTKFSGDPVPEITQALYTKMTSASFRLGFVGTQGTGKTTLINTLLCFPYFPVAQIATTSCKTYICYGKETLITVLSHDESQQYCINLQAMSTTLFTGLKRYAEEYLLHLYDITSLSCFIDPDSPASARANGSVLHMDYSDTRCRATLVLHLLQTYVDQNVLEHDSPDWLKAVNRDRERLLDALGIPAALGEYTIRFSVNRPLLKNGLELVDLPGSGSIVKAGNCGHSQDDLMKAGMKSCDAILLLMEPSMSSQTLLNLDLVLEELRSRSDGSSTVDVALIPVLNKMDIPGATGCQSKIDIEFSKRKLKATYSVGVIRISAEYAEKRIYDANPDLSPARSRAGKTLSGVKVDSTATLIRQIQGSFYEKSGFDLLLSTLEGIAAKARQFACTQLLRDINRLYIPFLLKSIEQLKRQKRRLKKEALLLHGLYDTIKEWSEDGPPRMAGRFAGVGSGRIEKIAQDVGNTWLCEDGSPYSAALKALREQANQRVQEAGKIVTSYLKESGTFLPVFLPALTVSKHLVMYAIADKTLGNISRELDDDILSASVFDEIYAHVIRSYVNAFQDTAKTLTREWADHINQLRHSDNSTRSRAECFLGQLGDRNTYSQEVEALAWHTCDAFFTVSRRLTDQLDTIIQAWCVQTEDERDAASELTTARLYHDKGCNNVRKYYKHSCDTLRKRLSIFAHKDVTAQSLVKEQLDEGCWSSFQKAMEAALPPLQQSCRLRLGQGLEQIVEAARYASQQADELQLAMMGDFMEIRRENEAEIKRLEGIVSLQATMGRLPNQDRLYPEITDTLRLFAEVQSKAAKAMVYNA